MRDKKVGIGRDGMDGIEREGLERRGGMGGIGW